MTGGCGGGGTKGRSSHSILLALSLTIRGTALCARQAASHLGRRHHANSFVSSKGRTLGIYGRWQTPFPSHSCHLWTWVKVNGLEDAQGAIIWHLQVSSGVPAGMWWHQMAGKLAKDEGEPNRTETLQHLILLIRAKCSLLISVIQSKEGVELSTKESLLCIKPQNTRCGKTKAKDRSIISRGCEASASYCANSLPPLPHIFPIVNSHFLLQWMAATLSVYHRHCCNRRCQSANHLRACLQEEERGRMDLRDYAKSWRAAVYNFIDTKERQKMQTWGCIIMNCQDKL